MAIFRVELVFLELEVLLRFLCQSFHWRFRHTSFSLGRPQTPARNPIKRRQRKTRNLFFFGATRWDPCSFRSTGHLFRWLVSSNSRESLRGCRRCVCESCSDHWLYRRSLCRPYDIYPAMTEKWLNNSKDVFPHKGFVDGFGAPPRFLFFLRPRSLSHCCSLSLAIFSLGSWEAIDFCHRSASNQRTSAPWWSTDV